MKNIKRLSIMLAAILAASAIFTSCSPKSDDAPSNGTGSKSESAESKTETSNSVSKSELPIVAEKASLKVLVCVDDSGGSPISPKDIVLHQEIAKATNVDIEWTEIATSAWPEKKGLVLASGDLPDVFLNKSGLFTDAEMLNMAEQKTIIPLNPLFDYAPNFNALMTADPALASALTAEDGNIYGFPNYIQEVPEGEGLTCSTNNVFYINKKWLDAVKMDVPKTTDEFKKVLEAFKTKDPNGNGKADEIPMSAYAIENSAETMFNDWFGSFGRVAKNTASNAALNIGLKDGKAIYEPAQPEFKAGIEYFADLNAAGLLDVESFTQDSKVFNAKLKSPERIVGAFKSWRGTSWRLSPEDTEYIAIPPLTGPNCDSVWPRRFDGVMGRSSYLVTKSCKNPELAVRWGDNLMSEDNTYQFWTNVKIDYNIEAVEGGPFKLINPVDANDAEYKKQTGGTGGAIGICAVSKENRARKPQDADPLNVDNEKNETDKLYSDNYPKEFYPNVFLNTAESKVINEISTELNNYVIKTYAEWITKGGVEKGWDAYLKQLDAMGLPKMLEQYQAALDRFNSKS